MKVMVLAVGKMRDRHLHAACDDYLERARRHLPVEVVEVADDDELVRRIPPSSLVVALTPGGQSWDTPRFSGFIGEQMLRGTRALVFLIGGADGLSQAALARSAHRLSLSALTLPHRLARVVLCEQVYRALSILRGEPYSR